MFPTLRIAILTRGAIGVVVMAKMGLLGVFGGRGPN